MQHFVIRVQLKLVPVLLSELGCRGPILTQRNCRSLEASDPSGEQEPSGIEPVDTGRQRCQRAEYQNQKDADEKGWLSSNAAWREVKGSYKNKGSGDLQPSADLFATRKNENTQKKWVEQAVNSR